MARRLYPNPTVSDLRLGAGANGGAMARLRSHWGAWQKTRALLARLPTLGVPVSPGFGQPLAHLRTSEGEIRQAVAACAPAVSGAPGGSTGQLQCWLEAVVRHVAEMKQLLARARQDLAIHEREVVPATEPALKNLREAQLRFVEQEKTWIKALEKLLVDPNRGWDIIVQKTQDTIRRSRELEADIQAARAEVGRTQELDAFEMAYLESNLEILRKVMLPLVDASLAELKVARAIDQISHQSLARTAETARDRTVQLHRELVTFLDYLRSRDNGGLVDGVMRFLFGAEPGKKIATIVVGTALAVGAVVGTVALARWAFRRQSQAAHG